MTPNEVIDRSTAYWACPPVRIEWRGVLLQLRSGKSAWTDEDQAKKAFISHIDATGFMFDFKKAIGMPDPISYNQDELKAFVNQQINDGEIKFVKNA